MSLNAKTPVLVAIMNVAVVATVVTTVLWTKEPVAILGLFFLQNLPVFAEQPNLQALQAHLQGMEDEPDDYNGTKVGFTAEH